MTDDELKALVDTCKARLAKPTNEVTINSGCVPDLIAAIEHLMRERDEARNAALEEAAKHFEQQCERNRELAKKYREVDLMGMAAEYDLAVRAGEKVAAAIRALKGGE